MFGKGNVNPAYGVVPHKRGLNIESVMFKFCIAHWFVSYRASCRAYILSFMHTEIAPRQSEAFLDAIVGKQEIPSCSV